MQSPAFAATQWRFRYDFPGGILGAELDNAMRLGLAALVLVAAAWPMPGEAQQGPFAAPPAAPKAVRHPAAKPAAAAKKASPAVAPGTAKVIKDPAEYNDYTSALNIADPGLKAAAMEAFVGKYPGSVVKLDALEQAMAAHQRAGDTAKLEANANSILQLQADNVRALAIVTFLRRARASQGDAKALADMLAGAARGLDALPTWAKPADMTDDAFAAMRKQVTAIFAGAIGFGTLQAKDYAKARTYYQMAFASDPNNLQDVYQLAIADLQMQPIDVDGLWYIARAATLAKGNDAAQQSIVAYGKARYKKYHGGEDGWDELLGQVAAQAAPPPDFARSIKPAPTLAELAVQAVRDNDPASLSFADWEVVLSQRDATPANKDAAAKVWQVIQATQKNGAARLKIPVKILAATRDTIQAAITDDNQRDNKVDLVAVIKASMPSPPPAGATIEVTGVIVDYLANPITFIMRDGEVSGAK
jgi:tetratricopeptide (TPR) repeat protein